MMTESFTHVPCRARGTLVRLGEVVKGTLTRRDHSTIHSGPFPRPDPALSGEKGPGATREADAPEHPSRLSHFEGPLRLRRHLGDALDWRRSAPRHLLELPSLLHRQAEADRHAGPHRPVPEEVRQRAEGAAEEGQGGSPGEEGRCSEDGEEGRQEAEGREEAQGGGVKKTPPPWGAAGLE